MSGRDGKETALLIALTIVVVAWAATLIGWGLSLRP